MQEEGTATQCGALPDRRPKGYPLNLIDNGKKSQNVSEPKNDMIWAIYLKEINPAALCGMISKAEHGVRETSKKADVLLSGRR